MVIVKFIYSYFKFKRVVLFVWFLVYDKYGNFINILWACDCELNLINQIIICHFEHNEESQNSVTIKDLFKDDTNPSYIIDGIEFVNGEKLSVEQIVDIMLGKW